MSFSEDKARAIVALPLGAEFETRRLIADVPADAQLVGDLLGQPWVYVNGAASERRVPRYRPGCVYPLGFPHWRTPKRGEQGVYVPVLGEIIWDSGSRTGNIAGVCADDGWRPMVGYVMPAYAYTHWGLVLSAEPQRLQEITEAQAVAELVDRFHGTVLDGMFRDYGDGPGVVAGLRFARDSYFTLIDKIHGPGTAARNEWFWRYRLRLVPQPEGE